jgi:hypothetical protein
MLDVARNTQHGHNMGRLGVVSGRKGGGPLMFGCCMQHARNIFSLDFELDG